MEYIGYARNLIVIVISICLGYSMGRRKNKSDFIKYYMEMEKNEEPP